jgi:ABC-type Mn2+/Zn2+ transport system ATPase subunit
MIRILLQNKYKSLLNNIDITLPDFTILSGVNGAGKSHLLTALNENGAKAFDEDGIELTLKKYVTSVTLVPNDAFQVDRNTHSYLANTTFSLIQNYIHNKQNAQDTFLTIETFFQTNLAQLRIIKKITEDAEKDVLDLTQEDVYEHYPIKDGLVSDIFYQEFSNLFKRYADKQENNYYKEYLKKEKGKNVRFLTEEKFVKRHGLPPWEIVNRIFEEAKIDYTINDPIDNNRDLPFTFKLIHKLNGADVNFRDLSSGEKVLMSLTLALYNSKHDVDFPKLLLIDEPDAPLHPSMAKQLLDVIQEIFVKEKGVKVIMTTHSPSTIAMAPDESLYVMQKQEPRIQKKSKEQIMKLLTYGIPAFSIYADNRRQVFVESAVDADFYTRVYGKLKSVISNDKSLYFISSGITHNNTGNCNQVKEIVNILTRNGNQTIFGIIDWDSTNNGNENIVVLGLNQRYSIENYIFDPILLAAFLLREKIKTREYFGLEESENYFDFPKFTKNKLQKIVDKIISDINSQDEQQSNNTLNIVHYNNGQISLEIPLWYLHHQGHDLENKIKKSYQELNKYKNSESLKSEIVKKVIDDLPEFISMDFINLFQSLLNK